MIYTGRSKLKKAYIGDKEVKAIYTGMSCVYISVEPITDDMTILVVNAASGDKIEFSKLGSYNGAYPIVDWGDGEKNYQLNHTYTAGGEKTIKIYNSSEFRFSATGGKDKLKSVLQVSKNLTTFDHIFENCRSLEMLGDNFRIPVGVTNCNSAFAMCTSLKALPEGFEIPEGVIDCFAMFNGCSSLATVSYSFHLPSTVKSFPSFMNAVNSLYVDIHDLLPSEFKQTGIDCGWAFANASGIMGDAPAELLWDDKTSGKWSRTTDCFKGSGLANLDQIPKEWGGNLNPEPAYDLKVVELGPDVSAADRPETSDIDFTLYGMNLLNMGFFEIKDTSTISWPSWSTNSNYWNGEIIKAWTSNPEDIQHSTLLVINMEWGCNFFSEYLGVSSLLGVYIPGIEINLDTQYNLTVEAMGLGSIGQSTIKFGK